MGTAGRNDLHGESSIDELALWGWKQYRSHPVLVYPFVLFGLFSLLLELRIEFVTTLFDLEDGFRFRVDTEAITVVVSDRIADVVIPVLEEVLWLLLLGILGIAVLTLLLLLFAIGIAFLVAADVVRERERTQFQRAWQVTTRLPALFAASIITSALIGTGLLLLVVPGVYLAIRTALTGPAIVIDGYGPVSGIRAGWEASSGQFLSVFGLGGLGGGTVVLVAFVPVIGELVAVLLLLPVFSICLGYLYVRPDQTSR